MLTRYKITQCCRKSYPQGIRMSRLVNFSVRLFSLDHHDRRAFYTSPVLKNQTVFVLYRVLAAAFWGSFNVWSILVALSEQNWLWFARLTHWTMTLLTAHLVYSAALAWKHRYCSSAEDDTQSSTDNGSKLTWYYKTAWLLANLAYSSSFCVTALYLTLIATPRYFIGIMEHIVNSVIVTVDILLTGIPVKMSHFVYPDLVGASYAVFSIVYWALGGLGKNGETFLYPPLRYEEEYRTRTAFFIVVCLVVVLPMLHALCCVLCHLRSKFMVDQIPRL